MNKLGIIVDVETTGLDPSNAYIIKITAIEFDLQLGDVFNKFTTFCRPTVNYTLEPLVTEITGITDHNLIDTPSTQEAIDTFSKFANGRAIWAYNAGYVSKFINHNGAICTIYDIMGLAKASFPRVLGSKLDFFCSFLNISNSFEVEDYRTLMNEKDLLIACLRKNESSSSDHAYCYSCDWSGKNSDLYMNEEDYICPACGLNEKLIYNYPSGNIPKKDCFNDDDEFLCGVCNWSGGRTKLSINGGKYACPACNRSKLWSILRCNSCDWVNFDFESISIDSKYHCPKCMTMLDKNFLPSLDN